MRGKSLRSEHGVRRATTLTWTRVRPLVLVSVLAAVVAAVPGTARPAYPGANGEMAFASERDGNFELYRMNADGSDQTRLTTNPADDREPAWSPDGNKIAFVSNFEIYRMNADGTGQVQLTHNAAGGDEWPTWSPDGSKIAFTSYGGISNPFGAVYLINEDGTGRTQLTNNPQTISIPPGRLTETRSRS
jgi:dipeptidyl aminopeptidase/acylaminoacyl peptidase